MLETYSAVQLRLLSRSQLLQKRQPRHCQPSFRIPIDTAEGTLAASTAQLGGGVRHILSLLLLDRHVDHRADPLWKDHHPRGGVFRHH